MPPTEKATPARYPLEQRIEDKKRGIGRQKYPFLGAFLSAQRETCTQSQISLGLEYSHGCSVHLRISCQLARSGYSSFIQGMLLDSSLHLHFLFLAIFSQLSILCLVHLQLPSSMSGLGFLPAWSWSRQCLLHYNSGVWSDHNFWGNTC
jgi:hypothetical protein